MFELRLHRLYSTKPGFLSFVVGGNRYDACLDNFAKDPVRFEILIYPGEVPWCAIATFQVAGSIGFKGDFRHWEHLLGVGTRQWRIWHASSDMPPPQTCMIAFNLACYASVSGRIGGRQ